MKKLMAVLAAGFVLGLGVAEAVPVGDYGDAPDPAFPSLYASTGPYHLDVSKEWIGVGNVTTTTTEADSLQPDADADGGYGSWVRWPDGNGVLKTWFVTKVSYDPSLSTAADTRYLNVLGDLDGNGAWGNTADEWAVRNMRVPFEALPVGRTTLGIVYRVPDSILPGDLVDKYTRVTLSERTVDTGTGDWGEFDRGETEDWLGSWQQQDPDPDVVGPVGGPAPPLKPMPAPTVIGAANGVCDICGCAGICLPPHGSPGDPARGWAWSLTLPLSTTHLMVKMVEVGRDDAQALCPDTVLRLPLVLFDPVWGISLPLNTLSGDLIKPGPVPVGPQTFTERGALMSNTGHTSVRFFYGIVFDPAEEWLYVWDYSELGLNVVGPIPEPAGLALAGLALLTVRRKRR